MQRWRVGALALLVAGAMLAGCEAQRAVEPPADATVTATVRATSIAASPTPRPPAAAAAGCILPCANVAVMQSGRVLRIVDGDTLHVEVQGHDERVRLYGVDAPEVGDRCSAEASARLTQLAGDRVYLLPDARDRDRYGRLLRYVYRADGDSIDARLVADGLAHAWRADGALRGPIEALEEGAMRAGRGCLWSSP